ncbi:alpha-amlyase [Algibacter amylolyticus]|uniref:Alpha-amlyase n=1 Tax=Algibacter amylolyticus TaxID=1608400 RepID=A0A5M7BGY6_9FLAO|nr:alpha-amylase family glycosyl hydrolase [Algibacter amylolyticus]KAA5828020.1 alpha-amylase [Algibacter amylolyticus]MBB5267263.1 alpha-amylase [Algibacter amylolyticus]TSJ82265.1 alpha-amlyase [Algibacter amylolyticus]
MKHIAILLSFLVFFNCENKKDILPEQPETPFVWQAANIYFLLTDRFNNGDVSNDINFERNAETGKLRGFKGGDIKGVTQKIKDGYFTNLGINAIWMTPIVEQIHGGTDEGTGLSYGFHGYWASDWTALDPNFGTKQDLHQLVETAHKHGIRILLDAVINHTGPVTEKDPIWPSNWVRTQPHCDYQSYQNTITCTLVKNLPDIKTESDEAVKLPPHLVTKWQVEGRYESEVAELDAFFKRTNYPRAPRFYIMKWLTDYITEFGIDGYRVDTVKHVEEHVWQEFKQECDFAFAEFKKNNPDKVLDNNDFYLLGEVYNYGISATKGFDFGDKKVNYFDNAFNALINFEMKWNAAQMSTEAHFKKYSQVLNSELKGYSLLNYLSSHDDGQPFDAVREKPFVTATRLLLCPGASQVYYGDESARSLVIKDAVGDATLRSFMNWDDVQNNPKTQSILKHWQKLGQFRANHPAVGAGIHQMITETPYVFYRSFSKGNYKDLVVVGLNLPHGEKVVDVSKLFKNGETLHDAYSGVSNTVTQGKITINSKFNMVLLEKQ